MSVDRRRRPVRSMDSASDLPPLSANVERGVCIFCGFRGKLTGEHVWPDRLREFIPAVPGMQVRLLGLNMEQIAERTWPGDIYANKPRVTCHDCNHGWLNKLEDRAMPWLRPMVSGSTLAIPLSRDGQTAVAAYVLRVLVIAGYMTPDPLIVLPSATRSLFNHHEPSPHEHIWVGNYDGSVRNLGIAVRRLQIEPTRNSPPSSWSDAYVATLGIGNLAVQIFGHDGHYPLSVETRDPREMLRIWPRTPSLSWPPPLRLNDEGLQALIAQGFDPGSPLKKVEPH